MSVAVYEFDGANIVECLNDDGDRVTIVLRGTSLHVMASFGAKVIDEVVGIPTDVPNAGVLH